MILKRVLRNMMRCHELDLHDSDWGKMTGFCVHGNGTWDSTKFCYFIYWL